MTRKSWWNVLFSAIFFSAMSPASSIAATSQGVRTISPPATVTATQQKALVITSPTLLVNFSLARTIDTLLGSSGTIPSVMTREAFLQTLLNSFTKGSGTNNGVLMPITPRPTEAALIPKNLLDPNHADFMRPVAVLNRMDLIPTDGSNCGEQRIIYEKGNGLDPINRMTLIFEAVMENPAPWQGVQGCRVYAQTWWDFQTQTDSKIKSQLDKLFYTALNVTVLPAVHFAHYGNPLGQIRINTFVNDRANNRFVDWMLREYRFVYSASADKYVPSIRTVANSPWQEVYAPINTASDPATLRTLKTLCQNEMVSTIVPQVFSVDTDAKTSDPDLTNLELISKLGALINGKCNGFENNSSTRSAPTAPPIGFPTPALQARVDTKIAAIRPQLPYDVSSFFMLNRLNTQSCAGCHQLSNGAPIAPAVGGGSVDWPFSLGFVHIDESGQLSPLLKNFFLPTRFALLSQFMASGAAAKSTTSTGTETTTALSSSSVATADTSATVSAANSLKSAQTLITSGTLSAAAEDALIQDQRDAEKAKPGAFFKIRPTH